MPGFGGGSGKGAGGGRGGGMGRRSGKGAGAGKGRQGGFAAGPGGACVCPKCGKEMPHTQGVPCSGVQCPDCGIPMTRKATAGE